MAEIKKRRVIASSIEVPQVPKATKAAEVALAQSGPALDGRGANGVHKDYTFELDFMDQRKRRWMGRFRCHALTYREKMQMGLLIANLANGLPVAVLPPATQMLIEMLGHLLVAIDEAPPWASKLDELHDEQVVAAIYKEVLGHERRFHGDTDEEAGSGSGEDTGGDGGVADVSEDGTAA